MGDFTLDWQSGPELDVAFSWKDGSVGFGPDDESIWESTPLIWQVSNGHQSVDTAGFVPDRQVRTVDDSVQPRDDDGSSRLPGTKTTSSRIWSVCAANCEAE
jgi:hypothetical protein